MEKIEKPFWDHLEELRDRLMKSLYALLATSSVGYLVRKPVL
jgi:Sec-independent protein secretion pathway component TatC